MAALALVDQTITPLNPRQACLRDPPRIEGLWTDLNPSAGGLIFSDTVGNTFSVDFASDSEFPNVGANNYEITLKKGASKLTLDYDGITALAGLAGFSCGGQHTTGSEPKIDLSSIPSGELNARHLASAYKISISSDNDLNGFTTKIKLPKIAP